jgi:hypothetical protein
MGNRSRLLAAVGTALASNMTFKVVPNIATGDPDIYDIAHPWNNNYALLSDVFEDISASPGCTAASVTIFNPDQSSCTWSGPFCCNAPIPKAVGIRVTTIGPCHGWVIVGSHDPVFAFNFATADPDIYFVAVPYHTTAMNLSDLFDEIPNAASVAAYDTDQSTCTWTGNFSCNQPLQIFQGVRVTVKAPGTWRPEHY